MKKEKGFNQNQKNLKNQFKSISENLKISILDRFSDLDKRTLDGRDPVYVINRERKFYSDVLLILSLSDQLFDLNEFTPAPGLENSSNPFLMLSRSNPSDTRLKEAARTFSLCLAREQHPDLF